MTRFSRASKSHWPVNTAAADYRDSHSGLSFVVAIKSNSLLGSTLHSTLEVRVVSHVR